MKCLNTGHEELLSLQENPPGPDICSLKKQYCTRLYLGNVNSLICHFVPLLSGFCSDGFFPPVCVCTVDDDVCFKMLSAFIGLLKNLVQKMNQTLFLFLRRIRCYRATNTDFAVL